MKKIYFLLSMIVVLSISLLMTACDKDGEESGDRYEEEEGLIDITAGEPYFTVTPGSVLPIHRVAWTGDKLWAVTGIGGGDIAQKLLEIDTADGSIIQSIAFNGPDDPWNQMFSLDYANGKLLDIFTHVVEGEQKYARTYDVSTGAQTADWNYSGKYKLEYHLTFDGTHYWGQAFYICNGFNCTALVAYDTDGNVVKAYEHADYDGNPYNYVDLIYGGGYFWGYQNTGIIRKLDGELNIVESYKVTDHAKFGTEQYSNEIAMHLEYIGENLWIIDRQNNFYKIDIESVIE